MNSTRIKIVFLLLFFTPGFAVGDYDFEGQQVRFAQNKIDRKSKDKWKLVFSGLFDFRLVSTGSDRNWLQENSSGIGGPGLTRFGGTFEDSSGTVGQKQTNFQVGQVSLISDVFYEKQPLFHLHFNIDERSARLGDFSPFILVEANFKQKWEIGDSSLFGIRAGLLIPPLSHEHLGMAWTSEFSITPSAINSWVGEELRPLALETTWTFQLSNSDINLKLATFSQNDGAGTLLSWRGWALHDFQSGLGTQLRFQERIGGLRQTVRPFEEVDGNLGFYSQLEFDMDSVFKANILYWNNNSKEDPFNPITQDVAWNLEFITAGFTWTPGTHLTIISQALVGSVEASTAIWNVNNDFQSFYTLVSYQFNPKHRISLRYDNFLVEDQDQSADQNDQDGQALTVSYLFNITKVQSLALEFLSVDSERSGNSGFGTQDPDDDLIQISYRLKY